MLFELDNLDVFDIPNVIFRFVFVLVFRSKLFVNLLPELKLDGVFLVSFPGLLIVLSCSERLLFGVFSSPSPGFSFVLLLPQHELLHILLLPLLHRLVVSLIPESLLFIQPQLSELLNGHRPDVPTQENHLPAQTLARLLVALRKVEAQKNDRVAPLNPLEGQLGFQEERIRD